MPDAKSDVKSDVKAEIKMHGMRWINGDRDVTCPECGASGDKVNGTVKKEFDLSTAKDPAIGRATNTFIAHCFCNACKCMFEITRSDV